MAPRFVDVLLIGGGVAAARCARTLRRAGFAGSILLVGEEPMLPYNRPPLSKELLRGEVPDELVLAEPASWYERRGVDVQLGVPVAALVPDEHVAELADGTRLRYGQALLATGASARRLSIEGSLVLRTIEDAHALREVAREGAAVTVVGGGFIGVEASASLAAAGARVTLVGRAAGLWAAGLGAAVSEWAVAILREAGVDVRLGAADPVPADATLVGVGVTPRVELAQAAGLEVDDGVVVDERWHAARESGERAALAMLGDPVPPIRAAWVFSEFAGHQLDLIGVADPQAAVEIATGLHAYVRDGRVVGVALQDGAADVEAVR